MPVVTSMVAVSLVWQLLYFPKIGLFALLLSRLFGLDPNNLTFLQNPATALFCIIVMDIWKDSGLRTAVFLAGIDEIPDSLYEAARIEGASEWRQFLSITIPLLRPQIIFLAAIYSINAIRVYVPIYMMTGNPPGGPANSTKVLAIQMEQEAGSGMRFGYGATVAMVIFVLLMGLVIVEIRAFEQKWEY
jgi:multiple sugar transport system permease protein